jgi:hypothetical protein
MKKTFQLLFVTALSILLAASCQRNSLAETFVIQKEKTVNADQPVVMARGGGSSEICNPAAYVVTLESRTQVNGSWEWVWSIQNTKPGSGNNGTAQDLSNWGMPLSFCADRASVVGAAYSADGISWTNFTPSYAVDPSQGCLTVPVVKFDFGTFGSAKSYYRLVVSQDYEETTILGYYKSGSKTSCCTFNFTGIGCGGPEEVVE